MQSSYRVVPAQVPTSIRTSVASTANEYGIHDTMRHGLKSVRSEVTASHPLERHLEKYDETQTQLKHTLYRQTYGLHAPLRLKMEHALVSQPKRLPGIPSSNLALDILSGRDTDIDFEDFLNDPKLATQEVDLHASMEVKLGWKVQ